MSSIQWTPYPPHSNSLPLVRMVTAVGVLGSLKFEVTINQKSDEKSPQFAAFMNHEFIAVSGSLEGAKGELETLVEKLRVDLGTVTKHNKRIGGKIRAYADSLKYAYATPELLDLLWTGAAMLDGSYVLEGDEQ